MQALTRKHADSDALSKNNKKLVWENTRLKEERVLLERENDALKNLIRKQDRGIR